MFSSAFIGLLLQLMNFGLQSVPLSCLFEEERVGHGDRELAWGSKGVVANCLCVHRWELIIIDYMVMEYIDTKYNILSFKMVGTPVHSLSSSVRLLLPVQTVDLFVVGE